MPISNLLYDRPDLDQDRGYLPLFITGTLPDYAVREAYEGRLQIHNAIGVCRVDQIAGDTLPLGSQMWVDHATQQIVVAWPAYSEEGTPLENQGFEQGDTGGWTITIQGEREGYPVTAIASADRPHAGQYSAHWLGNEGYGHARGVESVWENNARGLCYPMQRVTGSAWIALEDTEASQNRGQVRLHWYDAADGLIGASDGTLIRGHDRQYRLSTVSAVAPAGVARCVLAVWTTANYSGGVRFDDVSWDLPTIIGTAESRRYCITLRVRDSAGRTAYWSGCIGETEIYFTSRPYATELVEAMTSSAQPAGGREHGYQIDAVTAICTPLAGTLRTQIITYLIPDDAITTASIPLAGTLKIILATYAGQAEAITSYAIPLPGGVERILITYSGHEDAITTTCTPLRGTLT